MPGKIGPPAFNFAIRLSRSSSFTRRVRRRCSLNSLFLSSPRVVGRDIADEITSRKLYAGPFAPPRAIGNGQQAIGFCFDRMRPAISQLPIAYRLWLLTSHAHSIRSSSLPACVFPVPAELLRNIPRVSRVAELQRAWRESFA